MQRDDLLVKRMRDGRPDTGTIMDINEIKEG
jgi:hypothetical protein